MPLRIRAEVLDAFGAPTCNELSTCLTNSVDREQTDEKRTPAPPFTLEQFVQQCPFIVDEAWAMEEYQRLCPSNPRQWYGSHLPSEVWSPPGTQECPFHTVTEKKIPDAAAASSTTATS